MRPAAATWSYPLRANPVRDDLYGLSLEDWTHLTGTFTFGSGATKQELDEIIRQTLAFWGK